MRPTADASGNAFGIWPSDDLGFFPNGAEPGPRAEPVPGTMGPRRNGHDAFSDGIAKSFAEDVARRKAEAGLGVRELLAQQNPILGPLNDAITEFGIDVGRNHPFIGGSIQAARWLAIGDGSNADSLLAAAGPLVRIEGRGGLAAAELRRLAATAEERVTPALTSISEAAGGKMVGLDYRLKSVESLTRKIEANPDMVVNDALRYTMTFERENFTSGVRGAMSQMSEQGYELSALRNSFKDGVPYKGINTTYRTSDGELFELQFHTPESFDMKQNVNHEFYEQMRVLPEGAPEWQILKDIMVRNSASVPIPEGVSTIRMPKNR